MSGAFTQLVADIGGTNARFGLVSDHDQNPAHVIKLATADYPDLPAALHAYVKLTGIPIPPRVCIAVAGPTDSPFIQLTNGTWRFSPGELKRALALDELAIINDFAAMAWAVSAVSPAELVQIGGKAPVPDKPIAVIGPGTGFGVALLLPGRDGTGQVIATEGGHASLAPRNARELALFAWLLEQGIFPCRETLLSGQGLQHIYRALSAIDGLAKPGAAAAHIQRQAVAGEDALATETLELFCALLGTAAADQALCCGALGGVYITGGIVRRFIPFLRNSRFRARFESERSMGPYLQSIPAFVVTANHLGLRGAALAR